MCVPFMQIETFKLVDILMPFFIHRRESIVCNSFHGGSGPGGDNG